MLYSLRREGVRHMDYQKILLIGNTTSSARVKEGKESGNRYADFVVAARKGTGETTFYPVRCFGKLAEGKGIQAIKKGTRIFVEGEPDIYTYVEGDDATKHIRYRVIVNTYRILDNGRRPKDSKPAGKITGKSELSDEDLPL